MDLGNVNLTQHLDHLFGIVVSTSDCHPRGPGFDSRLYPRNFFGSIGSGTGFTQPREDNWAATWYEKQRIRLRKLKLRLRNKRFANHKAPCTVIWQQPLQSVLALRSCSATDLINFNTAFALMTERNHEKNPNQFGQHQDFNLGTLQIRVHSVMNLDQCYSLCIHRQHFTEPPTAATVLVHALSLLAINDLL